MSATHPEIVDRFEQVERFMRSAVPVTVCGVTIYILVQWARTADLSQPVPPAVIGLLELVRTL